jgi:uncharacterized YigZ family protein
VNIKPEKQRQPYRIPVGESRAQTEVSRSRFIASLGKAATVPEARAFIAAIRTEMPEANHHVYAFRVGHGNSVIDGLSDDGEPTGTSGPPVMAVLRGSDLGDVALVVTRYFGGTKLGTGGLVRAYSDAARAVLAIAQTVLKIPMARLAVALPYPLYERVKLLITAHEGTLNDERFAGEVALQLTMPIAQVEAFTAALRNLSAGKIQPRRLDETEAL